MRGQAGGRRRLADFVLRSTSFVTTHKSRSSRKQTKKMVETRSQHRRRVTWDAVESAQGVFIDILSRVPVRSIRSFKRVNRYWHRTISNKYCAKKHLSQSRKKPQYIACPTMDQSMELYLLKPGSCKFRHLTTVDPSERSAENSMYMIASFNGLVCCINQLSVEDEDHFEDLQIWICNPSTGETLLLPQSTPSFRTEPSIGVAYGPDMSEYKIFRLFCVGDKKAGKNVLGDEARDASLLECEVYSSSTAEWRNIGPVPHLPMHVCFSPHYSSHVFAGGKIYWLVSLDDPGKILFVDMEERFGVIKLPTYCENLPEEDRITEATYLVNLRGSLGLVILHVDFMDIWVWREDCEDWELVCVDYFPSSECFEVVFSITSSEKEVLFATDTHLWTYNLNTKKWKRRSKPPTDFESPAMFPFTESILPCNGGTRLGGKLY